MNRHFQFLLIVAAFIGIACTQTPSGRSQQTDTQSITPQTPTQTHQVPLSQQPDSPPDHQGTSVNKSTSPPPMPIHKGDDAAKILGTPMSEMDLGQPIQPDNKTAWIAKGVMTEPGDLPRLKVAHDGKQLELPLKHTHVSAEVTGFVTQVTVTQTYQNPFQYPIEAVYVFPLPENSAVDDMKIRVGDRLIEAEIKRRDDARRTYEEAKAQGHTAALLEQERPNVFTQSVANIAPGHDIDVVIRYVQDLSYDAGQYEFVFPMVVGPRFIPGAEGDKQGTGWSKDTDAVPDASRITPPIVGGGKRTGHDISVEVIIDRSLPIEDIEVFTHEVDLVQNDGDTVVTLKDYDSIPNRDFVMRYRVAGDRPQGAILTHRGKAGGYYSLVIQPPSADLDTLVGHREMIFVVDISGSMYGTPLGLCKEAMREAIRKLRPTDIFNVFTFAGTTAKVFEQSRPANAANIRDAMDFIQSARAGGGTQLNDAVTTALSPQVTPGRNRYVFFLTDGYVGNEAQILDNVRSFTESHHRDGLRSRAFAMGVGSSVNRYLLDGIAKAGEGLTVYSTNREDPTVAVNKYYHYVDQPVMTDITIDWGSLKTADAYPHQLPDLFVSRPLTVHGRFTAAGTDTVIVRGKMNGQPYEVSIPVTFPEVREDNAALATLWARARIEELEQQLWNGSDTNVEEQIASLGIDFRIVTAFTSFVAVDRSVKVSDGNPTTVVQPVEVPEGVVAEAAAPMAAVGSSTTRGNLSAMATGDMGGGSIGGLGLKGMGSGGGGYGHGRATATASPASPPPPVKMPMPGMPQPREEAATAGMGKIQAQSERRVGPSADPAQQQPISAPDARDKKAANKSTDSPAGPPKDGGEAEKEASDDVSKQSWKVSIASVGLISGTYTEAEIRAAVQKLLWSMTTCMANTTGPDSSMVTFSMTLDASGRITHIAPKKVPNGANPLASCLSKNLHQLQTKATGKLATVEITFRIVR
ncbi:MAG: VWA domain-containing protein [Myxococcales bacterium]|nr:VWA domain-containing protein [Myxococcales bacterium]